MSTTASATEPIQGGLCTRCRGLAGPPPLPPLVRVDRRSTPDRYDEGLSFAELINQSDKTARRKVAAGEVESIKIGSRRMVFRASVDDYLLRLKNGDLR